MQDRDTKRGWRRALTVSLGIVAVLLGIQQMLVGEVIPPLSAFMIIFTVIAVASTRTIGRGAPIAAIVASVLLVAGSLPFIVADLAHPDSVAGFAPIWLVVLSTTFVVISAVLEIRKSATSPRGFAIGVAVVAVLGLAGSAAASAGAQSDDRLKGDVAVVAQDVRYPEAVEVPEGAGVFIENRDVFRHTFVVEGSAIELELPGSTNRRVDLGLDPGTYSYLCNVPGHEEMKGTLLVTPT